MSILIKGMEMPIDCPYCPLAHWNFKNEFMGCEIAKKHFSTEELYADGRPEFCPLVPVPPHGIIDREQILDAIRLELAQANAVNDMEDYDSWMRVFDYVRKFPTVIPASEECE